MSYLCCMLEGYIHDGHMGKTFRKQGRIKKREKKGKNQEKSINGTAKNNKKKK